MRAPNLDQLRSFSILAAAGSFSAAARRLNLTQPAVSRQIRELEKRFGVRLIERAGRRARPTRAGEKLLEHMQRIEAAVADAMAIMAPYREDGAGRVVLGTGATACIYLLPPILQDLRRRFPALQILVHTGNTPDIVRLIEDNVIDVGLVTAPVRSRSLALVGTIEDEQVAVFPRSGLTLPKSVTPVALAELPLLLYEPGGHTRRVIDDWFARERIDAKPVMELGSVEAIKELVHAGLGCAVLPRMAMAKDRKRFIVRSLSPPLRRKLNVAMRRDKVLTSGLRHLLKALKTSNSP
jgi:DNA-binding transcriptional LysR family regulator